MSLDSVLNPSKANSAVSAPLSPMKGRCLFISNGILGAKPDVVGGDMRFIEIAKVWAARGAEIHLCSSISGETLCRSLGLNFTPHRMHDDERDGRLWIVIHTLLLPFRMFRALRNFQPDVVYSTNEQLYDVIPGLMLKLKFRKKIRWGVVVHIVPPSPPWKRENSNIINSILFYMSERISVWMGKMFADVLLPVSSNTAGQLADLGVKPENMVTVECGIPLEEVEKTIPTVKEKVYDAVFVKRIQRVKGAFDLVDIWEKVVRVYPKARLLLIGWGVDGDAVKKLVKERGLEDRIHFAGVVYDFREKYTLICQSKLCLLPSYEENWAIVIGEAMAAGVPVVAYGLPDLISVWKDHFVPIPTGDTDAFAKEIISLLGDEDRRERIASGAKAFVQRLDWRNIAQREWLAVQGTKGL